MDVKRRLVLSRIVHRDVQGYKLEFNYEPTVKTIIKSLPGARWSQTHKAWWLHADQISLQALAHQLSSWFYVQLPPSEQGVIPTETKSPANPPASPILRQAESGFLSEDKKEKIEQMRRWMRARRYSENTIITYTEGMEVFLKYFYVDAVEDINNDQLVAFNNDYILAKKLSSSYQNQIINAVKLFYRIVESRNMKPELIWRPKREKKLPNVLSKEEVKLILNASGNIKHRAMVSLIYSCGLRCGELLKLMPQDVDSRRGLLMVRQAKGRKDRIVPLSMKVVELLREYFKSFKPKKYLFEGMKEGEPYDERSLQNVLKQCKNKAGIVKPVTLHWLRHSYATHLLENGTDLRYIQEILGHRSSRTTEIYTHVSTHNIQRIVSPFDYL